MNPCDASNLNTQMEKIRLNTATGKQKNFLYGNSWTFCYFQHKRYIFYPVFYVRFNSHKTKKDS